MVKKILVRAPNWVGDGVMATPALAALRTCLPKAQITLLAKPAVSALLLHQGDIDRVMIYEDPGKHTGPVGFLRLVFALRKERFDMAFLLQNAFEAAALATLAGIPERLGYDTDGRRFLLTRSRPKKEMPLYQCDAFSHLVSLVTPYGGNERTTPVGRGVERNIVSRIGRNADCGTDRFSGANRSPFLDLKEEERVAAHTILEGHGILKEDVMIGICPGAAKGPAKQWLPERFAEVADHLAEKFAAKIIILGGPNDRPVSEIILSGMKKEALLYSGMVPLREMMAIISLCNLCITNDSGAMHIASAFGTPYVTLFGSTVPEAVYPGGDHGRAIYHSVNCSPCGFRVCPVNHHCMSAISVQEVIRAAEEVLNLSNNREQFPSSPLSQENSKGK